VNRGEEPHYPPEQEGADAEERETQEVYVFAGVSCSTDLSHEELLPLLLKRRALLFNIYSVTSQIMYFQATDHRRAR
jgi:hypothetical protein